MSDLDMFDSAVRAARDFGAFFEYADGVGYFYLLDLSRPQGSQIIAAIKVVEGLPGFGQSDVAVRWNQEESWVGLLIRGQLWAAFEPTSALQVGGGYHPGGDSSIPSSVVDTFICS